MNIKKRLSILFSMCIVFPGIFNCHAHKVFVAFVGDSMVGKTCILGKMMNKDFNINEVCPTDAAANYLIYSGDNDTQPQIFAIEPSGKKRYKPLIPDLIKNVSMSVVCASIADEGAYEYGCIENIPQWVKLCRESTRPGSTILLAINKSNEPGSEVWEAQEKRIREIADELSIGVMFVNAKTGDNIDRLKNRIVEMCPMLVQESQENQCKEKDKSCLLI